MWPDVSRLYKVFTPFSTSKVYWRRSKYISCKSTIKYFNTTVLLCKLFLAEGKVCLAHVQCKPVTSYVIENKYLLLTEFEVRNLSVSYGPSFFLFAYGPRVKRAGHKSRGKNKDP